jgi:hypothetical protein
LTCWGLSALEEDVHPSAYLASGLARVAELKPHAKP